MMQQMKIPGWPAEMARWDAPASCVQACVCVSLKLAMGGLYHIVYITDWLL